MFSVFYSGDSHVDIITTINACKSDIDSNFLYCPSTGHHNNSRGALLELCATGSSGCNHG